MNTFKEVMPVSVEISNLSVTIATPLSFIDILLKKEQKAFKVLKNISFKAAPGQVVAIMGSSGSGKTTLLHALAGRNHGSSVSGNVYFEGQPDCYKLNPVGYVQQHDHLVPFLTVRETLRFCARLRINASVSLLEKYQLVEEETIVGNDWAKGISGGEKRRLSIGCQLLLNPSVLFLDEATTGLDSFSSFNLITTLVNLSRRGRTIFISIHQPRSDIFSLFDSVILLAKGETVYAGPGGLKIISYFAKQGFECPPKTNPADYLIDVISIDDRDEASSKASGSQVDQIINCWSAEVAALAHSFSGSISTVEQGTEHTVLAFEPKLLRLSAAGKLSSGASPFRQTLVLTQRTWTNLMRDNLSLWGSLVEAVVVAVVFGVVFYQVRHAHQLPQDQAGVLSRRAALYIVASVQTYLMLIFTIYKITSDMVVFDRERSDNMYDVVPYLLSQLFAQLPFLILFPTIFSLIIYFEIGLRSDELAVHLFRFIGVNILSQLVVMGYSQLCVSVARDFASASLVGNSFFTFFSFSTGFFFQLDQIPVYLRWMSSVSFLTYQYRAMASNEFSNNVYACSDRGTPCLGNDILTSLGLRINDDVVPYLAILSIYAVFITLTAVLLSFYKVTIGKHAKAIDSSVIPVELTSEMELDSTDLLATTFRVHVSFDKINLDFEKRNFVPKYFGGGAAVRKSLLKDVSVEIPPASLTMIMGGSGTGKSTLLSLITGRVLRLGNRGKVHQSGRVLFNGVEERNAARTASICSFVPQNDGHLLPALTCRETLYYAALLRLSPQISKLKKRKRAEEMLRILGLLSCADTIVGNELVKGLSGGEKRRLSIGVQMLTDPSILVIDEPTSGLDAFTANHVMATLKKIANSGRTVICSIHQPRTDIFKMFDNILLLARGGRVGYAGAASLIIPHFASMGHALPPLTNPADYILDISCVDFRSPEAESKSQARMENIISVWTTTCPVRKEFDSTQDAFKERFPIRKPTPISIAFPVLTHRSFLNARRQPLIVVARILQVVFLGVIISLYNTNHVIGQSGVQNRIGILQQSLSTLFVGLLNCVAVFPAERNTLHYEYEERSYSIGSFFLAYNMIELPVEMVSALLFTIFALLLSGLNTTWYTYLCMSLCIFCLVNLGESIGIAVCSMVEHVGFSVSITNSILGIFTVMSGFLSSSMPIVFDRINRLSPIPYISRLLAINEFEASSIITCTNAELSAGVCFYRTGADVLRLLRSNADTLSFDPNAAQMYLGALVGLTIAYRVIAYLVLRANC